jgi:hypothetical protein
LESSASVRHAAGCLNPSPRQAHSRWLEADRSGSVLATLSG